MNLKNGLPTFCRKFLGDSEIKKKSSTPFGDVYILAKNPFFDHF